MNGGKIFGVRGMFIGFVLAAVLQSNSLFDAQRFDTRGLSRADGLEIVLNYPEGWDTRPGRHPHVLQDFNDHANAASCNLLVRNLGTSVLRDEIRPLLREAAVAPEGMTQIQQKETTVDSLPALSTLFGGEVSSGGISFRAVELSLATVYNRDMIILSCTKAVKSSDSEDDVAAALLTFQRIGNSIVIKDQWQR